MRLGRGGAVVLMAADDAEGWWHANLPESLVRRDDEVMSLDQKPTAAA
jgi:hypothetical protein